MYHDIDDISPELTPEARERRFGGVIFAIIIGLGLLLAVITFRQTHTPPANPDINPLIAERTDYHTALQEPHAGLRRARLTDFKTTYPQSARLPYIDAQLAVMNRYEAEDWARVTDAAFDPNLSESEKQNMLQAYETRWGRDLLGGRSADIQALEDKISEAREPQTNRALDDTDSPIPDTLPGEELLGGADTTPVTRPSFPRSRPPDTRRRQSVQDGPPRVRRNVKPRYPNKALRARVEATVTLRLSIDTRGRVQRVNVEDVRAARYEKAFVKAARRAARRTRFFPKIVDGQAVPSTDTVKRYRFTLEP